MSADPYIEPPHYRAGPVECIDGLESMLTNTPTHPYQLTPFQAHLQATAVKYLWRCGRKGDAARDAKKAAWYIDRLIKSLEEKP